MSGDSDEDKLNEKKLTEQRICFAKSNPCTIKNVILLRSEKQ